MDDETNVTIRKEKAREKQPKQQGDLTDAIEAALGPIRKDLAELRRIDAINKLSPVYTTPTNLDSPQVRTKCKRN